MQHKPVKQRLFVAAAAVLLGIAACETSPDSTALLEQARTAITQAEADPNVTKYAPTVLDRARKLLVNAEGAAKDKGAKDPTAAHYAYLTTQMARIAQQRAREQAAMVRIKAGETEREKILSSAREKDAAPAITQASQTSRGLVVRLDDVSFDKGKAQLKSAAERSIDQVTAFLNDNPHRHVQVEGFTDSEGASEYNLELSQSRADAVAMALIHSGIDAQRVRAIGYGEQYPVANNATDGIRELNRRVEIIVSNDEAAIPGRVTGAP